MHFVREVLDENGWSVCRAITSSTNCGECQLRGINFL